MASSSTFVEKVQKKAAEEFGMKFERDVPIDPKKRGVRSQAKVWGLLRELQSELADEHDALQAEINRLHTVNHDLLDRAHLAERDADQMTLQLKLIRGDFTDNDRKYLAADLQPA